MEWLADSVVYTSEKDQGKKKAATAPAIELVMNASNSGDHWTPYIVIILLSVTYDVDHRSKLAPG